LSDSSKETALLDELHELAARYAKNKNGGLWALFYGLREDDDTVKRAMPSRTDLVMLFSEFPCRGKQFAHVLQPVVGAAEDGIVTK
jgi:hypothetical protein